ncbi:hypothetical protein E1B28_009335 [Marasmius oreades]|uniref:Uncharacterized protein n=1 Tax=Marasmius oreades TaxID=181124 RepID=A0A9P7S092_9AGAR|nr:uncharacterized protein E1B28_009335 [Marasmius oreades]KAG7093041.1 hypothetical protein E1B28_009335 [Marasmius oreades]
MFSMTFLALSALVGSALAQGCSEAERFGTLKISPNPIVLGQEVTFEGNFTCAREKGLAPVYTDYWLTVPEANNSGFQPPSTLPAGMLQPAGWILSLLLSTQHTLDLCTTLTQFTRLL